MGGCTSKENVKKTKQDDSGFVLIPCMVVSAWVNSDIHLGKRPNYTCGRLIFCLLYCLSTIYMLWNKYAFHFPFVLLLFSFFLFIYFNFSFLSLLLNKHNSRFNNSSICKHCKCKIRCWMPIKCFVDLYIFLYIYVYIYIYIREQIAIIIIGLVTEKQQTWLIKQSWTSWKPDSRNLKPPTRNPYWKNTFQGRSSIIWRQRRPLLDPLFSMWSNQVSEP